MKIDGGVWYLGCRLTKNKKGERTEDWFWTETREMALHYREYWIAEDRAERYNKTHGTQCASVLGFVS
jgi:hypothetical protein